MASTRRLAAILAADIVGYSRLMGLDEAGTVAALREHRAADPIIAEQWRAGSQDHRRRPPDRVWLGGSKPYQPAPRR